MRERVREREREETVRRKRFLSNHPSPRKAKVLSVLDLDVPPSVAVEEACLGTTQQVVDCVKNADILKPANAAAQELLQVMSEGSKEDVSRCVCGGGGGGVRCKI